MDRRLLSTLSSEIMRSWKELWELERLEVFEGNSFIEILLLNCFLKNLEERFWTWTQDSLNAGIFLFVISFMNWKKFSSFFLIKIPWIDSQSPSISKITFPVNSLDFLFFFDSLKYLKLIGL